MPTTRRQAAIAEGKIPSDHSKHGEGLERSTSAKKKVSKANGTGKEAPPKSSKGGRQSGKDDTQAGSKRNAEPAKVQYQLSKKAKLDPDTTKKRTDEQKHVYQSGTIERGHIYFLYRPRVQVDEAQSIDDIRNFHIILIPRPPDFAQGQETTPRQNEIKKTDPSDEEQAEMKVLAPGADAVPAPDDSNHAKKSYRLITVGKKKLPSSSTANKGGGLRKETFWGAVTVVGDDLDSLAKGLGEKSYETKTRGTRHEAPARLVARGGYAIVNSEAETPSKRETHLGYHVSHPRPTDMGDVQKSLGIFSASSFILQVKNPLAPATGPQQAHSKPAEYPNWIMRDVFGAGQGHEKQTRGREHYGLRFASCETPKLLDYKGTELLLIAARDGEEGLEISLGEGRGSALSEMEEKEAHESVEKVFEELGLNLDDFPVESLGGSWI